MRLLLKKFTKGNWFRSGVQKMIYWNFLLQDIFISRHSITIYNTTLLWGVHFHRKLFYLTSTSIKRVECPASNNISWLRNGKNIMKAPLLYWKGPHNHNFNSLKKRKKKNFSDKVKPYFIYPPSPLYFLLRHIVKSIRSAELHSWRSNRFFTVHHHHTLPDRTWR